ncbi:hypothetical protein B0H12DRAFT_1241126 [Mycena haematopus]|nr:hypothetical protein B0H12DRAFT_1241126 [Mycena haematopus]
MSDSQLPNTTDIDIDDQLNVLRTSLGMQVPYTGGKATFGVGGPDILDESYRKAGKIDL